MMKIKNMFEGLFIDIPKDLSKYVRLIAVFYGDNSGISLI